MRYLKHNIDSEYVRIYSLFDWHVGPKAFDEDKLRRRVARISKDDKAVTILGGDYGDFIAKDDPRFDQGELADWIKLDDLDHIVTLQSEKIIEIASPILHTVKCFIKGNHEGTIEKHRSRNIYRELYERMGLKDVAVGTCGYLTLNLKGHEITIYTHHGQGYGSSTASGSSSKMERALKTYNADLIYVGHNHRMQVLKEAVHTSDGKHIRTGVHCGSYLEDAAYAELKGYPPLPTGSPITVVNITAKHEEDKIMVVI